MGTTSSTPPPASPAPIDPAPTVEYFTRTAGTAITVNCVCGRAFVVNLAHVTNWRMDQMGLALCRSQTKVMSPQCCPDCKRKLRVGHELSREERDALKAAGEWDVELGDGVGDAE